MFKIEGDYMYINVYNSIDYGSSSNGQAGVKATVSLMPDMADLLRRLETMEREWNEQKQLIQFNPAVKEAYTNYLTMVELAKEPR